MAYTYTYYVGGNVQAQDYNTFVSGNVEVSLTPVNDLWGTGANSYGYGQTEISTVAANAIIGNTEWAALYNTIESVASHNGATVTPLTTPSDGDIIVAYAPTLTNNLANISAARLNAVAQGSTAAYTVTSTQTWNDSLTFTWSIPFGSDDEARYFFNCGGQIGLSFFHPIGTGYTINQLINQICSDIGTIWLSSATEGPVNLAGIDYYGVTKRGGQPDTAHPSNPNVYPSLGFYSWTPQYQYDYVTPNVWCISQKVVGGGYGGGYGGGSYGDDTTLKIFTKYDGAGLVNVQAIINENPDPGAVVSAGTVSTLTIRPPSTAYLTNSWGTVTPTGVATTSTQDDLTWITPAGALPSGVTGVSYMNGNTSVILTAVTTDSSPITYDITNGELPNGLVLTGNTISGTPTVAISKTFTVNATSSNTLIDSKARNFSILVTAAPEVSWVTPSGQLIDAETGVPYSVQLTAAANDSSAITYSVNSGTLPNGLSLDSSTGMITGTPTAGAATFTFVVRASSLSGGGIYQDRTFSIGVDSTTLYFTAGSAYWVPTGVSGTASAKIIAGGGSGAGKALTGGSGAGGSGGINSSSIANVAAVTKLVATVGSGGIAASDGLGNPGNTSTLDVYTGGASPSSSTTATGGTAPIDTSSSSFGSGGSPNGTNGQSGNQLVTGIVKGGKGGSAIGTDGTVYGTGGAGGTAGGPGVPGTAGNNGTGVGSGGGGGGNGAVGGNGAAGEIRVSYYESPAKRIYVINNANSGYPPTGASTVAQTTTTYNWTVPSGLKSLEIYLIGAGGGGASTPAGTPSEGGGGGQLAYIDFTQLAIDALPSTITFQIGAGGRSRNGGVSPTTPGNATNGGSTVMTAGTLLSVTALGGLGGESGGSARKPTLPSNVSTSYWTINYYDGAETSGAGEAAKSVAAGGGGGGGSGNGGLGTAGGGGALGLTGKGGTSFTAGGDQRVNASSVVADTISGAQAGGGGGGVTGNNATGGWGGDGKVVIVASIDAFNATSRIMTTSQLWNGIVYDEASSRFIAASSNSRAANYSSDGITWNYTNLPTWPGRPGTTYTGAYWSNLAYGDGKTVLSGVDYSAVTTDGGTTWALNQMPSQGAWFGCAYGAGKFVAAQAPINSSSPTAVGLVAYSTNGTTWTQISIPAYNWYKLRFNNSLFTLAAYGTDKILTSPDGVTWTLRALPGPSTWQDTAYGAGKWVVVGYPMSGATGLNATLNGAYSTDGVTWTRMQLPMTGYWNSVSFANGKFVATGGGTSQSGNYAATSYDGINWVPQRLPATANWTNSAAGDNKIVVVGGTYVNGNVNTPAPINTCVLIT